MTDKQRIFADEYLKDLNGTRAYKVAYPNVKKNSSAATAAGRLLRNVEIKSYIDEQLEQMHNERTADAKEILEYLTAVMRGEETETVATAKGLYDGVEVSAKDRLKAAELLGKRHALFTDKQQIEVTEMPVFVDDIGDEDG
ncbi:terminase small subunit [Enterococcus avium]|jgi:phage terminase small subunit|uniref:terminase small subunit n=1 Tax=Enterococcus avium TaxID=33945 RepID=UPI001A960819|nr:terminase small subunit [Enterococcus avium]MBO1141768.1 terminase small subunit [Enterococcus avium]MDT2467558.1 terminase small subunit [Enterococcus avium]MDT2506986.1 terminase small subunit [Enterococcus avium]